ncbi:hypothetical protein HYH02_006825 [Chlamydomonas schloesseri]|uniref:Uncharacterized protein n=1 Tax=Chlamydomonas schloesseri TaxID=2026947 RepID=A0A835WIU3_9CHLO|nr:hypothetical protein HYH02_006825 [Chlamydomonas schloesseri]|eukprot:KAG2448240.1 hypothetical protein HYH02_006825 [Chlamydomonas schloesseri]
MAGAEELSRLEELLRRPDFVLEPNVKDVVRQYIKAQGKPEVILESLSEGYVGYAHMAMLMTKWLDTVDDEPAAAHDEFHYLKEFVKSKFEPDKFIGVFSSAATRAQVLPWLDGLLGDPRGRKLIYELSAQHRNSLLLNFAIQRIMKNGYQDEVAAAGSGLASYFSVFHKLLANKVAAVIAAVKRAAAAEAAGDGAGVARAQAEVSALVSELKDGCEHSQHTYLHVQHLLHHLAAAGPEGGGGGGSGQALLAAAQALEAAVAAAAPAGAVWGMQKLYLPTGSSPAQLEAAHLIGRMLQAGPEGPSHADTLRLHSLYRNPAEAQRGLKRRHSELSGGGGGGGGWEEEQAHVDGGCGGDEGGGAAGEDSAASAAPSSSCTYMSPAPLQHPRLVQALLTSIFTPNRPPSSEQLTAAADLLARATCTRPRPGDAARGDSAGGGGGGGGNGASRAGSAEAAEAEGGDGEEQQQDQAAQERIAETTQALQWAVGLLARAQAAAGQGGGGPGGGLGGGGVGGGGGAGRFTDDDLAMARKVSRLPVVAAGLLHAVACQLGSPGFYEDAGAVAGCVPPLVRISLLVATSQPGLAPKVLPVWATALAELHRAGQAEHCRLLLDGCVILMREAAAAGAAAGAAAEAVAAEAAAAEAATAEREEDGRRAGGSAPPAPVAGSSAAAAAAAAAQAAAAASHGVVKETMEVVETWSRQGAMDPALLRFFVLQVLGCFAPPYSPDFAGALLRLLLAAGVRASNVRNEAAAALLREFASAAEALGPAAFTPPLSNREQHLLAELAAPAGAAGAGGGAGGGAQGQGLGLGQPQGSLR